MGIKELIDRIFAMMDRDVNWNRREAALALVERLLMKASAEHINIDESDQPAHLESGRALIYKESE